MPTLQFSKNIRRRGRQVENAATALVRSMAKRTLRSLVLNTKVDTGKARSNWRVGVGAPTRAVISPYNPYPKKSKANGQGIAETANATAAIAAGNARINSLRGISGVGLKTALFISNNVDYIDKALLPGALEASIVEARAALRGFRVFDSRNDDEGGDV
jgi:hypothetical protein